MKKELISEIDRIKEIMGLSLITEQIIDDILKTIFKSVDDLNFTKLIASVDNFGNFNEELLKKFKDSLQSTTDESAKSIDSAIKIIVSNSNETYDDILKSILKNDEDVLERISGALFDIENKNMKISKSNLNDILNLIKKYSKDPKIQELLKTIDSIEEELIKRKNSGATPEQINGLIDRLIEKIKETTYSQNVKDFYINKLNLWKVTDNLEVKSNIFDKLKNDSKLSASKEIIGQKFKEAFYSVIESKGDLWWNKNKSEVVVSITDTDGSVKNLNREEVYKIILDQVNNKTKGQKLYATNPSGKSKITPDEFLKNLEDYKTLGDGTLNYLDTHNTEFLNILKNFINDKIPNPEETLNKIDEELQNGVYTEIDNVINKMKESSEFWDDVIKNSDQYSKEIQNTVRVGNQAEELIKNKIDTLFPGYQLFYKGGVGDALDKFVGIDVVIYKMVNGQIELKFLQVKNAQKMDFLGNVGSKETFLKIFNKNKVRISKPSQLDFVCYVNGDTVAVIKKDNLYAWNNEIQSLVKTNKSGFQSQNPYGYTEQSLNSIYAFVDETGEKLMVYTEN
jgi:hypothetical protein